MCQRACRRLPAAYQAFQLRPRSLRTPADWTSVGALEPTITGIHDALCKRGAASWAPGWLVRLQSWQGASSAALAFGRIRIMHRRPILARYVSFLVTAGMWLAPTSGGTAIAAQSALPPTLAQDGHGLFSEPAETRALFTAVWGDRAPAEWTQEHDVELSDGTVLSGPRVGFLYAGSASQNPAFTMGLSSGLRSIGYTPGQDISIVWRFAEGHNELLPSLAAELVRLQVDVIVTPAVAESVAAKQVTSSVPIVTMTAADPVSAGLVNSPERPGGNVTGVLQQPFDFNSQRLALLKEAVPDATRIGVVANVATPSSATVLSVLGDAAPPLGLELQILEVRIADDVPRAFASAAPQSSDALMVLADTLFTANRSAVVRLATETRIPTLYPGRSFVDEGVDGLRSGGSKQGPPRG
jgi:putative tryptophan/tyrosine transport system substrate-binding protein